MKKLLHLIPLILFCCSIWQVQAQIYNHPTTGIQNEFVGSCLVATCSGTYRDNGAGGNYSNNIGSIYRVFCPNTAGQCVRVNFNSFNVEDADFWGVYDYLTVGNGPTQNSPLFTTAPADGGGLIYGNTGPFSYTSSDASGCLTFRFTSDGSITQAGWSATLSCVPCAGGPNGTDNNDCINSTPVCNNQAIPSNASGPGIVAEGCSGASCPAGGENHTNWYEIEIQTSGTIGWIIDPTNNGDDYDFAVYGPNVSCGSLGSPIRCSDAGITGNTGANGSTTQTSEDVLGDGLVGQMNVVAGQTYYMVVDEWSPNAGSGYTLNWSGTASLDCTILLPVKLVNFGGLYNPERKEVDLNWITAREYQNQEFVLERSYDGQFYEIIDRQESQGNSTTEQIYRAVDQNPTLNGINYYRLQWTNEDGTTDYSEVTAIAVDDHLGEGLAIRPNPFKNQVELVFAQAPVEGGFAQIYNASGQLVKSFNLQQSVSKRMQLDLTDLDNGLYIINIQFKDRSYHRKIVKTAN